MKTWIKRTLLIGFIMVLIGIIMLCVGAMTGGVKYIKNDKDAKQNLSGYYYFDMKKTEIEGFESLDLNLAISDLTLKPSDDNNYYMEYHVKNDRDKDPVEYEVKNGVLHIDDVRNRKYKKVNVDVLGLIAEIAKGIKNHSHDDYELYDSIVLYVPKDSNGENPMIEGKIHMDVGDIKIDHIDLDRANLEISVGSISVRGSHINDSKIQCFTGDIELKKCMLNQADISGKTGGFEGERITVKGNSSVKLKTGDIELDLMKKSKKTVHLICESKYGDIETEGCKRCKSGEKGKITLTLNTETGDITVE